MTKDTDPLIGIWETYNTPIYQNFIALSRAYIDASLAFANSIVKESRQVTYHESCVIQYLSYHAVELFLKGGIAKGGHNPIPSSHNIYKLHELYQTYHNKTLASFNMPFTTEYLGYDSLDLPHNKNLAEPSHLLYRYPTNENNKEWETIVAFKLWEYIQLLNELKNDFMKIEIYFNSQEQTYHPD